MSDQNSTLQQMIINGLLVENANAIDNENQRRIDGVVQQSKSRVEMSAAKDKAEAAKRDADIAQGRLRTVQRELIQVKNKLLQVETSFDLFRQATSEALQEVALEKCMASPEQWLAKIQNKFELKVKQQKVLDEQKAAEPLRLNQIEMDALIRNRNMPYEILPSSQKDKLVKLIERFNYWKERGEYSEIILPPQKYQSAT